VPEYVSAFLASNYYYLNFGKALTKAMPLPGSLPQKKRVLPSSSNRSKLLPRNIFSPVQVFNSVEQKLQGQTALKAGLQQLVTHSRKYLVLPGNSG
jgi:hypothetical protein